MRLFLLVCTLFTLASCSKSGGEPAPEPLPMYFPPTAGDDWETVPAAQLGWDVAKLDEAINYAASTKTYGLIILYKGRIVTENYWNGWNRDTKYPINSAGKSVTAFLAGVAQQEGLLNINHKTSQYLGTGWTSLPAAKENAITLKHHLSMTTGLEDNVPDDNCMTPGCLTFKADAGTRWAYHNAPYRLMQDVIANASGMNYNQFTKTRLSDKIGMKNYFWFNYILLLNTRDMARFGLLSLNKGKWGSQNILSDASYWNAMTTSSQDLNRSYGYLWWLNGKSSYMMPGLQIVFNSPLAPDAPADMLMALGKDDKKIYVVPSLDLVVVRHGDDAGTSTVGPSSFDNTFWARLRVAVKKW
jgi:CubicO group peptidase (beta-lactamase class C family)